MQLRRVLAVSTAVCTVALLVACIIGVAGCRGARQSPSPSEVIAVEQVLANPQAHAHRVVTVHGCYVAGFERSTLQPCERARLDQLIWVENAAMIHSLEQLKPPGIRMPEPPELRTVPKSLFVFAYDEAKNRAAWKKLIPETATDVYRAEVIVIGQFETIAPQEPGPMRSGFGHLGAFSHELVLVDVLRSKPLPTRDRLR